MISNKFLCNIIFKQSNIRGICGTNVLDAARKGTRMKAESKKKANKKEVVKKEFVPYKIKQEIERVGTISPRIDDSDRADPVDNVYFGGMYKIPVYNLAETIEMHRETAHPTQFNVPNANVNAIIECSMAADKKNHYVDGFSNILLLPHQFEVNHQRSILTISKDEKMKDLLKDLGVDLSLGLEAIKMLEKGSLDLKLYDFVLCHSDLLPDLIPVRNVLKKKFPTAKSGTTGTDLEAIALRFLKGLEYDLVKDKYDHDYAKCVVKIGTLQTDLAHLENNLQALLRDIENNKPKSRSRELVTLVKIGCDSSREMFKINHKESFSANDKTGEEKMENEAREMRV